MVQSIFKLGF